MLFDYIDKIISESNNDNSKLEEEVDKLFEITNEELDFVIESAPDLDLDEVEDDAFSDLDEVLGEALVDQLRIEIINNTDLSEDQKMNALNKLETINLEENDFKLFMDSLLKPALEVCGYLNPSSEEPILVSVPVYEACAILNDAKNLHLTDIYKSNAKELIDNIVENDSSQKELIKKYNVDYSCKLIEHSLNEHKITDTEVRNKIVDEAVNLLAAFDFDSIKPNIIEAMKFIYKNKTKVVTESDNKDKIELDDVESTLTEDTQSRINSFIMERYDTIKESELSSEIKNLVRNSENRFLTNESENNLNISGSLASAAFSSIALAAYRNRKYSACLQLENTNDVLPCLELACKDAINMMEEQKSICEGKDEDSKKKCLGRIDKIIKEWEVRRDFYKEED